MTADHVPSRPFRSESEAQTEVFGGELARRVGCGGVVAITGPLGSGKTVLVRGMVAAGGGDLALVASPTFGLAHEYPLPSGDRIVHLDCYRLTGVEDLIALGWEDFIACPRTLTVIEWANRVSTMLPTDAVHVLAGHEGPTARIYEVRWGRGEDQEDASPSSASGEMP